MAQTFSPTADMLLRMGLLIGAIVLCTLIVGGILYQESSYATGAGIVLEQPVPFSHEHHSGRIGIDCKYCHSQVERSPFAGMPATEVCMNCHSHLWTNAEILKPVRESFRLKIPLRWTRVYNLPDFVRFRHDVHLAAGVDCANCHGNVASMPLTKQAVPLTMKWCLDCHRNPSGTIQEPAIENEKEPESEVKSMQNRKIYAEHELNRLSNCSTCHY